MPSKKRPTPKREWTEFRRVPHDQVVNWRSRQPADPDVDYELWKNSHYTVHRRELTPLREGIPPMVHLSICRNDRKAVHDWRDLQRIKNELVGPECEGMEMYPAESRLVDTSNQYHLWVVSDPGFRWSWGYGDRLVLDVDEVEQVSPGAVQRPLSDR